MDDIKTIILEEIDWRVNEISILKNYAFKENQPEHIKSVIIKYTVPAFYALWQGFFNKCLEIFLTEIKNECKDINFICKEIITTDMYKKLQFDNIRKDNDKKILLIDEIFKYIQDNEISIAPIRSSNLGFKETNRILKQYNLDLLNKRFEEQIDNLLDSRNRIAHGDFGTAISTDDIADFSITIQNLMHEIAVIIIRSVDAKKYLRRI